MVLHTQYIVVIFLLKTQHRFKPSIRNAVWNLWPMKCNFPAITVTDICDAKHCSRLSVYFHERQQVQHANTVIPFDVFATCWYRLTSFVKTRCDLRNVLDLDFIFQVKEPMTHVLQNILRFPCRFPCKFATDDAFQATGMSRPETR
jgi:hypothetical protein